MIKFAIRLYLKIRNSLHYRFYMWYNPYKYRSCGITVGKNPRFIGSTYISIEDGSSCSIGDNVEISSGHCYNPLTRNLKTCIYVSNHGKLIIGSNVGISSCCLRIRSRLSIGCNVKMGGGTVILDSNAHSINYLNRRDNAKDSIDRIDAPIVIEDDVLIGAYCMILKGVTIGARSVIGAHSVVTHDIPPDCIAAGNPCKVIRKLN